MVHCFWLIELFSRFLRPRPLRSGFPANVDRNLSGQSNHWQAADSGKMWHIVSHLIFFIFRTAACDACDGQRNGIPENVASEVDERALCIRVKCGTVATIGQVLQVLPENSIRDIVIGGDFCHRLQWATCIELDIIGANFSSFPTLATLLWTETSALISFDSSRVWRKCSSFSLDKLSASFSDVTSFDNTAKDVGSSFQNGC